MKTKRSVSRKPTAHAGGAHESADIWLEVIDRGKSLEILNQCSSMERVELVQSGIPAKLLTFLSREMAIPKVRLYETIGVARATADRKVLNGQRLDREESEKVLGMARLVGHVEQIIRESGDPERAQDFNAARWVANWLEKPTAALGGRPPGTLMDTAEGRSIVSNLVAQMQSGAYA